LEIITKYFPDLTDLQIQQFQKLQPIYSDWNNKINVISRADIDNLYERHVLHSLSYTKIISFKDDTSLLDIGTGGGFPGIPLAIFFPNCKFTLVDSTGKKLKVVEAVASELELQNVTTQHIRAEELYGKFDFVLARAVKNVDILRSWTEHRINKRSKNDLNNGWLLLKGGDLVEELSSVKNKSTTFDISTFFEEEFFLTKKVVHITK